MIRQNNPALTVMKMLAIAFFAMTAATVEAKPLAGKSVWKADITGDNVDDLISTRQVGGQVELTCQCSAPFKRLIVLERFDPEEVESLDATTISKAKFISALTSGAISDHHLTSADRALVAASPSRIFLDVVMEESSAHIILLGKAGTPHAIYSRTEDPRTLGGCEPESPAHALNRPDRR